MAASIQAPARVVTHTWRCCGRCNGPLRRVQDGDDVSYEHVLSEITEHRAVPR